MPARGRHVGRAQGRVGRLGTEKLDRTVQAFGLHAASCLHLTGKLLLRRGELNRPEPLQARLQEPRTASFTSISSTPLRSSTSREASVEGSRISMSGEPKVAIITGASQGIGAGLVTGFREHGYRVVANSRSIKPDAFGDQDVLPVDGDIADPRTAERVVGAALDRFGRVDTLVNNAGAFLSRPFVNYTEADFRGWSP